MPRHILNTVAATLLAMNLAVWCGLPAPQIAMACVFIVMQPQPEQVYAKGGYRLAGTVAGVLAAWAISSLFSASPARLLAAIGGWVTLFTVIAAFHDKLRAYSIVLTGYTPVVVGIPLAFEASHIGAGAGNRLAEVAIGVACAGAVAFLNGGRRQDGIPAHAATSTAPRASSPSASPQRQLPAPGAPPPRRWPRLPPAPPRAGLATLAGPSRAPGPAPASPARPAAATASLAGLHPAIAIALMATLWLATSWRGGPMATLNATVDCALVALSARPVRMALQMSAGTLLAVAIGLALQWCYPLLPASPWLLFAPALAAGAWMTGKPESLGQGLGYSITLCMLAYPAGAGHQYLHDAAGLTLSVFVLTAICAILSPLRPSPIPP
ncbi:FUSC family protein [Duganella aceris]|uniref:FUSC family protein n=1 Tax=Duganella aceris TaxID=2703883 RepID=A0ABX0FRH5_9BURK|nr:hypothetical protein [Duganella aceris]